MSGGTSEIHRDLDPLVTGTHRGARGLTLIDYGKMFDVVVATLGLQVVNVTTGEKGNIIAITAETILVSSGSVAEVLTFGDDEIAFGSEELRFGGLVWNPGDAYAVYKTATKGSIISTQWVDLSRGWKTPQRELIDGWREDDVDVNRGGEKMWAEGQPENYRR